MYKILNSSTTEGLQKMVEDYLERKWELRGDLIVIYSPPIFRDYTAVTNDVTMFIQVITKK